MSKPHRKNQAQDMRGRLIIVRAIVRSTKPHSIARAAAIAETAAKVRLLGASGRQGAMSERTLRGWVARYEAHGEAGLIRKAPSNAGMSRVHLSRQWDAAMLAAGVPEVAIVAIVEAIRACIRAAWVVTGGGWRLVQITVLPAAASLARCAGVPLADDLLAGPCMLPRRTIERDAPARPRPHGSPGRRRLSNE